MLAEHSLEAEGLLERAVKRDPALADAWVGLGESYWKKGNVQQAHDCFVSSINHVSKTLIRSYKIICTVITLVHEFIIFRGNVSHGIGAKDRLLRSDTLCGLIEAITVTYSTINFAKIRWKTGSCNKRYRVHILVDLTVRAASVTKFSSYMVRHCLNIVSDYIIYYIYIYSGSVFL